MKNVFTSTNQVMAVLATDRSDERGQKLLRVMYEETLRPLADAKGLSRAATGGVHGRTQHEQDRAP